LVALAESQRHHVPAREVLIRDRTPGGRLSQSASRRPPRQLVRRLGQHRRSTVGRESKVSKIICTADISAAMAAAFTKTRTVNNFAFLH
jgi:hypothetical protein